MQDAIEADLLAVRSAPFPRDEAGWTDRYVTSASHLDPGARPDRVAAAARAAWLAYGWAHPAAVAHLAHELGPLDG